MAHRSSAQRLARPSHCTCTRPVCAAPHRYKREPGLRLPHHFSAYFSVVAFCVLTYSLNLLPYIAVNRSAFCYHYMPALMYAELLSALTMDRLFGEANY